MVYKKIYIGTYGTKKSADYVASQYLTEKNVYRVETAILPRVNGKRLYVIYIYKEVRTQKRKKKKTNLQKMDKFFMSAVKWKN